MRTCVIFNPTARGDKAKHFRRHLDAIGRDCTLKQTTCAGDARRLAREAVGEGFQIITAAGGDGTVNEVLNGLAEAPNGCEQARLAVLPLGTVNVFARELKLPSRLEKAWEVVRQGQEATIDLPQVTYSAKGQSTTRFFVQLAGAGLDARAIELVKYDLKKKFGPLAYVWAGLQALKESRPSITVSGDGQTATGQLILIGNGILYGGQYSIFPQADLRDGVLDVCVFPKVGWWVLARCGPQLLLRGTVPASLAKVIRASTVKLTSDQEVPFELDGELAGHLPAEFSVQRQRLKVIVPSRFATQ